MADAPGTTAKIMRSTIVADVPLSGSFELRLENLDDPATAARILAPLMRAVERLGAQGGFCPAMRVTAQSVLHRILPPSYLTDGLSFGLAATEVDPRLVNIIRCLVVRTRVFGEHPRLLLRQLDPPFSGTSRDFPEPAWENEEVLYPEPSDTLSFTLDIDDQVASRMRRCMIEPRGGADDALAATIGDWIQCWATLLEAGAFALPRQDPEEAISVMGGVSLFDPWSIEIVVDRFDANEAAWHVLINVLDAFSRSRHPIEHVELA
jgi:hypothetical protein